MLATYLPSAPLLWKFEWVTKRSPYEPDTAAPSAGERHKITSSRVATERPLGYFLVHKSTQSPFYLLWEYNVM